jgi:hypothetical protein
MSTIKGDRHVPSMLTDSVATSAIAPSNAMPARSNCTKGSPLKIMPR